MGTGAPTPLVIPVHTAPKKAPCPRCGKLGHRKRTHTRGVRTEAFKKVAYLEITGGEYAARCGCCKTFRNAPEGVLPRALYDYKVRDLVLDRVLHDGMSVERTLDSLRREFLLDLSTLMRWCDSHGIGYVLGLAQNAVFGAGKSRIAVGGQR